MKYILNMKEAIPISTESLILEFSKNLRETYAYTDGEPINIMPLTLNSRRKGETCCYQSCKCY